MNSNITVNIVPEGTPVPDTGLFTSGIGGGEATMIGIVVITLLAIIAAVTIIYYRKKKQGTATGLLARCKQTLKSKKPVAVGLSALALLVSIGTVAGLLKLGASAIDAEALDDTEETAEVTDGEITIELGDEPVFTFIKSTVTVNEEMPAGYTLKAYSENPTLSSEGTDKTIDLVTIPEDYLDNAGSLTTSLTDNTWGLAIEEPESEEQEIYFSLPETKDEAVTIATVEDMEAEDSNIVTVYYGIYITPDMPYGTYTGASVNYIVEDNSLATVIFDGNGLYFNDDESQTTNVINYSQVISGNTEKISSTPNIDADGNYLKSIAYNTIVNSPVTIPGADTLHIVLKYGANDSEYQDNYWSYMTIWEGAHPEYTAASDYDEGIRQCGEATTSDGKITGHNNNPVTVECDISGDAVTFGFWTQPAGGPGLGYGYYAVVTGYDVNGNVVYLPENQIVSGEYLIPGSDSYYRFLGWDEDENATAPTYTSESDIEKDLPLVPGTGTTLYAIYESAFTISYNGNGADSTTNMDNIEQYTTDLEAESKTVDLLASNFSREGYGFVGWSEDQNAWGNLTDDDETNDPTIYGPNQTITVDPSTSTKLALYAVWAPAAEENGEPVALQDWQGCSNLTATTYDSEIGTLTVGKNTVIALTDNRDGNVYTVARLADGNCWMTENLRLDNKPELTADNTNNPSLPLTNDDTNHTTSNYLSASSNDWCSFTWSDSEQDALCANQSKLNTNNTALASTSPAFSQDFTNNAHDYSTGSLNANIYSYGNYYNWYSATAGNGTYSTGYDEEQETSIYEDTLGDICPTGWQFPYGGDGSEGNNKGNTNGGFYYLNQQMGGNTSNQDSNNWRSFPNNFVYSGGWYGSSAGDRGYFGYYWSSTASDTSSAFNLNLYSGYVSPGAILSSKYSGYSARCLAPGE